MGDNGEHVIESDVTIGQGTMVADTDDAYELTAADVSARSNWHVLPTEMKVWALETSNEIDKFVTEQLHKRKGIQKRKLDPSQLEMCLEDAETMIKGKRKKAYQIQTEMKEELERDQLTRLRDIHHDQESLSWFIMKRESEMNRLEQTKQLKQERLDQIVQATKSLVSNGILDGEIGTYELENGAYELEHGAYELENGAYELENGSMNGESHALALTDGDSWPKDSKAQLGK